MAKPQPTVKIKYVDGEIIDAPVKRRGGVLQQLPGQDQFGYGSKITTDRKLQLPGGKRAYRIYATCFSNCASCWITKGGERLHIRT